MNIKQLDLDKFNILIKYATSRLHKCEMEEAYELIVQALSKNPDAPEPHNLLGLWNEFKGDNDLARKHYRAAYALDPTYKAASKNLERVCTMFQYKKIKVCFGDEENICI